MLLPVAALVATGSLVDAATEEDEAVPRAGLVPFLFNPQPSPSATRGGGRSPGQQRDPATRSHLSHIFALYYRSGLGLPDRIPGGVQGGIGDRRAHRLCEHLVPGLGGPLEYEGKMSLLELAQAPPFPSGIT